MTRFQIDWEQKVAVCPQGHRSKRWDPHTDRHNRPVISIHFALKTCKRCPVKALCTTSTKQGRHLTVRPQAEHEAIQARRQYQETDAFRQAYAVRAGVEGVISQAAHTLGLRRARYRGLAKTHLQNVATATAVNLRRAVDWLLEKPTATTRTTRSVSSGCRSGDRSVKYGGVRYGWNPTYVIARNSYLSPAARAAPMEHIGTPRFLDLYA